MASYIHLDVPWNYAALERLDTLEHVLSHRDGIRALPLGDRDRYGRHELARIRMRNANVLRRLFSSIRYCGDIADENRLVIRHPGHYIAHVLCRPQKLACLEEIFLIPRIEL